MSKNPPADEQAAALTKVLGAVANLNDTLTQINTGMKTRDGVRLLGTNAMPVATSGTPVGNSGLISTSPGLIAGINLAETAGVATVVRILDGIDGNGAPVFTWALPANGSMFVWALPGGIAVTGGIFVQVVAAGAAVAGTIYRSHEIYRGRS